MLPSRKEKETNEQFFIRLCLLKLDKLLEEDYDWVEIAKISGIELSSSEYIRKMATSFKYYRDNKEGYGLDEKLIELKKEKVKYRDERNLLSKQISSQARYEEMCEILKNEIKKLTVLENLNVPEFKYSNKEGILLLSDWHYGAKVTNELNTYNKNVCKKRISELLRLVKHNIKRFGLNKITVLFGGDLIHGHIHLTNRLESKESVINQSVEVAEICSELLKNLSELVKIDFGIVKGNHERLLPNKDENIDKDNFTFLIEEFIKLRVKNIKNVKYLDSDKDLIKINVLGQKIVCSHGDKEQRDKEVSNLVRIIKYIPNIVLLCHRHEYKVSQYGETKIIVNGTLMGSDSYSKTLRLHCKPSQTLIILEKMDDLTQIIPIPLELK